MLNVHEVVVRYTDRAGHGHELTLSMDHLFTVVITTGPVVNEKRTKDPDLSDLFAKLDRDGRIMTVSPRAEGLTGVVSDRPWDGGNSVDADVCWHRWDCTWYCADS